MIHGPTGEARHSFDARTNASAMEAAMLGARIQARRRKRNETCAQSRHALSDCEDCDDQRKAALQRRFAKAEHEGTRILEAGLRLASERSAPVPPSLTPEQRYVLQAVVLLLTHSMR